MTSDNPVIDVIDRGHYEKEDKCVECHSQWPCLSMEAARAAAAQRSRSLVADQIIEKRNEQRKLFV